MEILSDKKNSLLKRREIIFVVESDKNPGYGFAKKTLAETLKVSEDLIVILSLKGKFGENKFTIESAVYETVEQKDWVEPKPKAKKTGGSS